MATPILPAASPTNSPEAWLRRKQTGNELAAQLRALADREQNEPFKQKVYACINDILIDAARTPARDRARVWKAMKEFGGGDTAHIAEHAKLPRAAVTDALRLLIAEGAAYESPAGKLYFLKHDPTAR